MSPTTGATVSCPACGEANRAEASFCRACGAVVASHANAYTWVSRIAIAVSLVSLATAAIAAAVAVGDVYSADKAAIAVIIAAMIWLPSSLVAFTFWGWSTAGLRARRSWGTVIVGILTRVTACVILMILGEMAFRYWNSHSSYRGASEAARSYRRQLEQNNIEPEGYY